MHFLCKLVKVTMQCGSFPDVCNGFHSCVLRLPGSVSLAMTKACNGRADLFAVKLLYITACSVYQCLNFQKPVLTKYLYDPGKNIL